MRILWGRANSSNVMKVIWLLEELGLEYERRDVGGPFGQTDTPDYLQKNPMGLVPTLEEDGFALFESNAILRYLCAAHAPASPLWPVDIKARARVDQWMDWQQTALNPHQTTVFLGLVRTPPDKRDNAAIAAATAEAGRLWSMLDARLARSAFAAGDAFSLADVCLGVHVHRWLNLDIDRPEQPNLVSWYERLKARPAYAQHIARPIT